MKTDSKKLPNEDEASQIKDEARVISIFLERTGFLNLN